MDEPLDMRDEVEDFEDTEETEDDEMKSLGMHVEGEGEDDGDDLVADEEKDALI